MTTTTTCPHCSSVIPSQSKFERIAPRLVIGLAIAILGGMLLMGIFAIGFLFVGVSH
jgi:hypothetical protein